MPPKKKKTKVNDVVYVYNDVHPSPELLGPNYPTYNKSQRVEDRRHVIKSSKALTKSSAVHAPPSNNAFKDGLKKKWSLHQFPAWLAEVTHENREIIKAETFDGFARMNDYKLHKRDEKESKGSGRPLPALTKKVWGTGNIKWYSGSLLIACERWLSKYLPAPALTDLAAGLDTITLKRMIEKGLDNASDALITSLTSGGKSEEEKLAGVSAFWNGVKDAVIAMLMAFYPNDEQYVRVLEFYPSKTMDSNFVDKIFNFVKPKFPASKVIPDWAFEKLYRETNHEAGTTISFFHKKRKIAGVARQREMSTKPMKVFEEDIFEMVKYHTKVVFSHSQYWDKVTIPVENEREWYGSACCLVQLMIGSRSRGVIMINKITPAADPLSDLRTIPDKPAENADDDLEEGEIKEEEEVDFWIDGVAHGRYVQVQYISKERLPSKRAEHAMESLTADKMTDAQFQLIQKDQETEAENRSIVKPYQFYFLDPNGVGSFLPTDAMAYSNKDKQDPMHILLRLLQVMRDYAYNNHIDSKAERVRLWREATFQFDGVRYTQRYIDLLQYQKKDRASLDKMQGKLYGFQVKAAANGFKVMRNLEGGKTHILRRLYVVYSWLMFASSQTKEIAYARRVLDHSSHDISVFYTSLHIQQGVGGSFVPATSEYLEVAKSLVDAKDDVLEMMKEMRFRIEELEKGARKRKRESDDAKIKEEEEQVLKKSTPDQHVAYFVTKDDEFIGINKLPSMQGKRPGKGETFNADFFITRGLEKLKEVHINDVHVQFRHLRSLRVNSAVTAEVWKQFTAWRSEHGYEDENL
jgi:hypothetical protein